MDANQLHAKHAALMQEDIKRSPFPQGTYLHMLPADLQARLRAAIEDAWATSGAATKAAVVQSLINAARGLNDARAKAAVIAVARALQ